MILKRDEINNIDILLHRLTNLSQIDLGWISLDTCLLAVINRHPVPTVLALMTIYDMLLSNAHELNHSNLSKFLLSDLDSTVPIEDFLAYGMQTVLSWLPELIRSHELLKKIRFITDYRWYNTWHPTPFVHPFIEAVVKEGLAMSVAIHGYNVTRIKPDTTQSGSAKIGSLSEWDVTGLNLSRMKFFLKYPAWLLRYHRMSALYVERTYHRSWSLLLPPSCELGPAIQPSKLWKPDT
ncbi:hypothetical protein BT96DRAFT_916114 [Gymnopus androsaceus JB14]|uniref:Uncharacterized protein n=1 Tax=Gymnopus androsaceus JB14 TaxID=1447944 RepID=A0A6A4I9C6_9AGAR|nr:hypothetical protein BT96DRAFT_916114 [Gymnopus androsaceus JB14]